MCMEHFDIAYSSRLRVPDLSENIAQFLSLVIEVTTRFFAYASAASHDQRGRTFIQPL